MLKLYKIVSATISFLVVLLSMQIPTFASETNIENIASNKISFEFYNDVSTEVKEKIISHFTQESSFSNQSRGLSCTLFGHDLETGTMSTVTHEARTAAPRCLRETFQYEICSRCDYSLYTSLGTEYIYCCS